MPDPRPTPSPIFRQAALDRLSSPEQLDRLITLAPPRDWAGLLALVLLVVLAVGWSVLGSVPTRVKGSGILITTGGQVFGATTAAEGMVIELPVAVGETVQPGQTVARIAQPDLIQNLAHARNQVAEQAGEVARIQGDVDRYAAARGTNLTSRRALAAEALANAQARAKAAEERLNTETYLLSRGLTIRRKVDEARQEVATAHQAATEARGQMDHLDAEEINTRNQAERDVRAAQSRLADARRRVQDVELQLEQRQTVTSPIAGRVTEIRAPVGMRVPAGTALVSIESGATGLQLLLYLPPDRGKEVIPGMDVRISPSVVKKEEFGTMIGRVTAVSDFPSTPDAMQATLQNPRLVQQFSQKGAPFAARIDLVPDTATVSGYRWSGGGGPPRALSSGTLADAEVTVREQTPVSFVIPLLRRATGL